VIAPFEYHRPDSLEEALGLLEEHGEDARAVAGGTALTILMKQRLVRPTALVALDNIPDLQGVTRHNGSIRIGAMTTHREAEVSGVIQAAVPLLAETLSHVATIRIRNVGTVGGNIAHADPNQDPPVSLIALNATVATADAEGSRSIPIEELFVDYYETILGGSELITSIDVPSPPESSGSAYVKFLPRSAEDYATVSAAAVVALAEEGGSCTAARVAVGSVAGTPVRATCVEAALVGQPVNDALLREAAAEVQSQIDPMSDARGSAAYKREMAAVIVHRALREAFRRAWPLFA
jgi:carbon-monoxide dehydrogenase medium subunit